MIQITHIHVYDNGVGKLLASEKADIIIKNGELEDLRERMQAERGNSVYFTYKLIKTK